MKAHSLQLRSVGGVEVQLHTFFTLALDGGECPASHPSHFIAGERAHSTRWIEVWVCPRASGHGDEKSPCPFQESVYVLCENSRLHALLGGGHVSAGILNLPLETERDVLKLGCFAA